MCSWPSYEKKKKTIDDHKPSVYDDFMIVIAKFIKNYSKYEKIFRY